MRKGSAFDAYGYDSGNRWFLEHEQTKSRKRKLLVYLLLANVAVVAMIGLFIMLNVLHQSERTNDNGIPDIRDNENDSYVVNQCRRVKYSSGWKEASANIMANLEPGAEPCMNFYDYACDGWSHRHPLQAGQASYTIYDDVSAQLHTQIRLAILAINKYLGIHALNKLRYAFNTCMDTESINSLQGSPFRKLLKDPSNPVGTWPLLNDRTPVPTDWQTVPVEARIGYMKTAFGVDTVLFAYVRSDDKDSSRYALELSGSMLPLGMGMSKAPYYVNGTGSSTVMLKAYADMIEKAVNLLKQELNHEDKVDRQKIDDLVELEKKLARATLADKDLDIDYAWNLNTLRMQIPHFNWVAFLQALLPQEVEKLLQQPDRLILRVSPNFLTTVSQLLQSTDAETVQNYLLWRLMRYSMPFLGKEFRTLNARFEAILHGKEVKRTEQRIEECVQFVNGRNHLPGLGYVTGRAYIDYAFSNDDRDNVEDLAEAVRSAYRRMIDNLKWLDTRTRGRAIAKLDAMRQNVGFPRWIRNNELLDKYYERLEFDEQDNALKVYLLTRSWSVRENLRQLLSTSVKTDDFGGSPTATNAWYNPLLNSLTLPAGEIQTPFYKADYPRAVVFGALGSVIGHEMTHAFDHTGSKFDENGKESNWWSSESKARFKNATACLVQDYNNYCFHGLVLCINGKQTLNENLADFGGLVAAYSAYKHWLHAHGGEEPSLPYLDMTMDQIFFISYASFWCGVTGTATLKNQLLNARHSPGQYRVIGPLRNFAKFSQAFNCPADSYMNPTKKCNNIWPDV